MFGFQGKLTKKKLNAGPSIGLKNQAKDEIFTLNNNSVPGNA